MSRRMQDALIVGLGLSGSDASQRAMNYLSEEPDVVASREELLQTKERLEAIQDRLFKFHA